MKKKDTILVVAAHPDDETLGLGGTIARLAREKHKVFIAILGEGITSRSKERNQVNMASVEALRAQSRRAAKILQAKDIFIYDLPDNRFDTVPLLDVVKIIENLIKWINPETIYTHYAGDLNIDHTITHKAVLTATRPIKDMAVKEIYAFEVPSSTEWSFKQFKPDFRPNVFVDISKFLDTKIKAFSCYRSEIRKFPHPRSKEAIRSCAQHRGSIAGYKAAEAFELIRSVR